MASTSNLFGVVLFLLLSVVTGGSFMSISPLVLELWQFLFIKDCPEIRKSEIRPSEFGSRSGDWVEQGIPNAARRSLIKCYWMPQNARVTVFTVSELIREEEGLTGGRWVNRWKLIWIKFNFLTFKTGWNVCVGFFF